MWNGGGGREGGAGSGGLKQVEIEKRQTGLGNLGWTRVRGRSLNDAYVDRDIHEERRKKRAKSQKNHGRTANQQEKR